MLVFHRLTQYCFKKIPQDGVALNINQLGHRSSMNEHFKSIIYHINYNNWILYYISKYNHKKIILTYNPDENDYSFKFVETYHTNYYVHNKLTLIHPLGEITVKLNNQIFIDEYAKLTKWAEL
jgi:hypothetical protein